MQDLATKFRPRCFDEVVGHTRIVNSLRADFEKKDPGRLYVLAGIPGIGKTTLARLGALYLNCSNIQNPGETPCGTCESCKGITHGRYAHLIEVNGADNTGIDDARKLLTSLRYAVSENKWRVLIMDECHRLSKQAWDLWLKPLEDGIARTVCFFCTTELTKVPKAILSRAVGQGFYFGSVDEQNTLKLLRYIADAENIEHTDEALVQLIRETGGSVRDAINALAAFYNLGSVDESLIRKDYGGVDPADPLKLFEFLLLKRFKDAYWIMSAWMKAGLTADDIYRILVEHACNLLTSFTLKYKGWEPSEVQKMEKQRSNFGEELIGEIVETLVSSDRFVKSGISFGYSVQLNLLLSRVYFTILRYGRTISSSRQSSTRTASRTKVEDSPQSQVESKTPIQETESGFPSRTVLDELAKISGGRVTRYNTAANQCLIFASDGDAIHVTLNKLTGTGKRYILAKDVASAIELADFEKIKQEFLHENQS